jgi:hypothetical protein
MARKPQPNLVLVGTSLDFFGVWEVTININDKDYVYLLSSEYAYNKFMEYYDRNQMGRAISCLNHFRIKPYLDKEGIER